MDFEEALFELRKGKKIRSPFFEDDEYLIGCYMTLPDIYGDDGKLVSRSFDEAKKGPMSIVKMKGKFIHDDTGTRGRQTLDLLLVMRDDWEIIE